MGIASPAKQPAGELYPSYDQVPPSPFSLPSLSFALCPLRYALCAMLGQNEFRGIVFLRLFFWLRHLFNAFEKEIQSSFNKGFQEGVDPQDGIFLI